MKARILSILAALMLTTAASNAADYNDSFTTSKPTFTWGADVGGSVDMTTSDMNTIDFGLNFGFRKGWINFLGVGAEADIMVSNSCRAFPIYGELRTNFVNHPTLAFWDLRAGISLNYLENDHQQTGAYVFTGVGFNLARSRKFSSHILVGYTYRSGSTIDNPEVRHSFNDLHYATVRLGVSF